MNKLIKLMLIIFMFCTAVHADTWFDSLKKTVRENPTYTVTAAGSFVTSAWLWHKKPVFKPYPSHLQGNRLGLKLGRFNNSTQTRILCTCGALGTLILGGAALYKLGGAFYKNWKA